MTDVREALMLGRSSDGRVVRRPLSPHLQVYKPQITTVLSILHRFAGVALAVGTMVLVWWLAAAARSAAAYADTTWFIGSPIGMLMLFGWTVALWYHFCNGIRHLFWDFGRGYDLPAMRASGQMVIGATAVLSLLTWVLVFAFR